MIERPVVAVLQPGYLPWAGFFEQLQRADVFVLLDDVQHDKHGWRNRNRIKGPAADPRPRWLTVPVFTRGRGRPAIDQVEIRNTLPWQRKHLGALRQSYARAPHYRVVLEAIEEFYRRPYRRLLDLDLGLIGRLCELMGLERRIERASGLPVSGNRSARLIAICRHLGAGVYYSGAAARGYLDEAAFRRAGIQVRYQDYRLPVHPQGSGAFLPRLSVIDMLFWVGPREALACIAQGQESVA